MTALQEVKILRAMLGFRESMRDAPPTEQQILSALAMCDDSQPQWRAIHAVIQQSIASEVDRLIAPGLTNEEVQYWRGRAAGLAELYGQVMQLRERGRKENSGATS